MIVLVILCISILISIPLAKWHSEINGDEDPFVNWRKNK